MKNKLLISSSPHIYSHSSYKVIMWNVVIALLPATFISIYLFRWNALNIIFISLFACVLSEFIFLKLRNKKFDITDGSAVVTGLLLALVMPPSAPLSIVALGAVVSIVVGKQVFGGLGNNIFNPVLVGRAFLMAAFPVIMTSWIRPFTLDAVTTATPLGLMKFSNEVTPLSNLFWGNIPGSLGETSAIALLIGGIYLVVKKYADWRMPLSICVTVFIFAHLLHVINPSNPTGFFYLLSGGLIMGSFFMATDPVSSPLTAKGRWIFGIGIGLIIVIIRKFSGLPEGVTYSILLFNGLTPLINRMTKPKRFGT